MQGAVWATRQGGARGVVRFSHEPDRASLISTGGMEETSCVLVDREVAVWVGAREGLFRLRRQIFSTFKVICANTEIAIRSLQACGRLERGSSLIGQAVILQCLIRVIVSCSFQRYASSQPGRSGPVRAGLE